MSSPYANRNRVLARLSGEQVGQLLAISDTRPLELGEFFQRFGDPTENLVFPLSGVVSLTVPTSEGGNVEVALVGREGVVGLNSILNGAPNLQALTQVKGEGVVTPLAGIPSALRDPLRLAVQHYAAGLLIELAQTAACNRVHSVEERLARWLLHAGDRAETTEINLTHEFLAMMMGVRRASVTVVVSGFEAAGLIDARRRRISLADRAGLEEISCSCYNVIRKATAATQA